MKTFVYPAPIYTFLDFILDEIAINPSLQKTILDCGAGGKQPPLSLFAEYSFEAWGIDISEQQIERALAFSQQFGQQINIQKGDMRCIPFADERFDFIYEFYSICHLSKMDTLRAVLEMKRVLKRGGLLFVGFMSSHCWPIVGQEGSAGEFALDENGTSVIHNVYEDDEPDTLFKDLEVIYKEKRISWYPEYARKMTLEDWEQLFSKVKLQYSKEKWLSMYQEREMLHNYTHVYYIARKPG